MPDTDERPAPDEPTMSEDRPPPGTAVVVRAEPVVDRSRWTDRVAMAAARLPDLARNPVVLASVAVTGTVAGEMAVGLLRRALGAAAGRSSGMQVTGVVVHHVHVVHHYVVHLVQTQAPSRP